MKLTKQQALDKIEELKKYIAEKDKEEPKGYVIKNRYNNSEIFVSTKNNIRDAVIEAVEQGVSLKEANLREADLVGCNLEGVDLAGCNLEGADLAGCNLKEANLAGCNLKEANLAGCNLEGADLVEAELFNAKFYGRGGASKLKRDQVETFLKALGFVVED